MSWVRDYISKDDFDAIDAAVTKYDGDFRAQQREREKVRAAETEEFDLDQSMTDKALSGVYGRRCKEIADGHVGEFGRGAKSLRGLRRALSKVEGRTSG